MKTLSVLVCLVALVCLTRGAVGAEAVYVRVPVKDLQFTDASGRQQESESAPRGGWSWRRLDSFQPRVILDGPGESYYQKPAQPPSSLQISGEGTVVVRLPEVREVRGRLLLPRADGSGMVSRAFVIPASQATAQAQADFYRAKWDYYEDMAARGVAGAAWFRHQADAARRELEKLEQLASRHPVPNVAWWRRPRTSELEETYTLFTGGRALSENLQLDRLLPPVKAAELTVDVSALAGITIATLDWQALLPDRQPQRDPLAAVIPADQHALFFPSFQAMLDLMDEADAHGTPILQLLEPRAEDAHTRTRYERQLGLGMSDLARRFGPTVVSSVAFTGSDPYLRMGSDVAVLFETKAPQVLQSFLSFKHTAALQANPAVQQHQGDVNGVRYTAVVSPDRMIASYVAAHGNVVMVTNSLPQLHRLVDTVQGKTPALAASEEYLFFRARYPQTDEDETALLILTDATIRRWCGPVWRIADSRRTRAAAVLAELQARHTEALVQETGQEGPLETGLTLPEAGPFRMTASGPVSETYGSLAFLTPIVELPIVKVTKDEARAYERFRETYQQNWRQFFDPIAVRFVVRPDRLVLDLTVMPLIAGTTYGPYIDVTRGAELRATAGDPHPEALWHFVMAINTASQTVQQFGSVAGSMVPGLRMNPLAWLGSAIAVYADAHPVWEERLKKLKESAYPDTLVQLPVALHFEVQDTLGLTVFLTALHAFIEQTAPGMTVWETLTHKDLPYIKVSPSERARSTEHLSRDVALYYAAGGGSLVVTLNEALLHRALERQAARRTGKTDAGEQASATTQEQGNTVRPWLGKNAALRVERQTLNVFVPQWEDDYRKANQDACWNNLPILNEWKRLFPHADPVQLHEQLWGTALLCASGGTYVWNEAWQTMESTSYGHPGSPKDGPGMPQQLADVTSAAFGLTFERNGLRVQAEIERKAGKP